MALLARKSTEQYWLNTLQFPNGLLRAVLAGNKANNVSLPGPVITANKVCQHFLGVTTESDRPT